MFNGKMKAVTFSYDDGVMQDRRLIEILDKYGLKCTFNINSGVLGKKGQLTWGDITVDYNRIEKDDIKEVYKNHEIAVHTLVHPNLTKIEDEKEIIRQVEEDRLALSEIAGYEVKGMAYPCGGVNNDDRVAKIIKENTGVLYSRTITSTFNFDLQENLYRFNPTVFHHDDDMNKIFELAEEFINLKTETPKIFYIWGHSYEFDIWNKWERFEEFCKLISGKEDIFYGTNSEILLA